MGGPQKITMKTVFSGQDEKNTPETPIHQNSQNPPNAAFPNILGFLVTMQGLETPIFVVFPEGKTLGFNYSPSNCQQWGSITHPEAVCKYVCICAVKLGSGATFAILTVRF